MRLGMGTEHDKHVTMNEDGQSMITVALMLVVLFGFLAMAVDIGYAWAQRRFMQNGADAGAFAAASLLASSVAQDGGGIYFRTDDNAVRRQAIGYAQENRVPDTNGNLADATNGNVTMTYLDQNGNVLAASPTGDNSVPRTTARVRVQAQTVFDTFFARVIGVNTLPAGAMATAAIVGSSALQSLNNLWPYGVWIDRLPENSGEGFDLWDPRLGYGNFKGAVDYTLPCEQSPYSYERCVGTGPNAPDPNHPGSHNKQEDVPYWVSNGFRGGVSVGNRLAIFGGDGGNTIGTSMNDYVLNNCPRGLNGVCEPDAGGVYAYAYVVVWGNPERWDGGAGQYLTWPGHGPIDRVQVMKFIVVKVYLLEDPNQTRAFEEVSMLVPPGTGPPCPINAIANSVGLVE